MLMRRRTLVFSQFLTLPLEAEVGDIGVDSVTFTASAFSRIRKLDWSSMDVRIGVGTESGSRRAARVVDSAGSVAGVATGVGSTGEAGSATGVTGSTTAESDLTGSTTEAPALRDFLFSFWVSFCSLARRFSSASRAFRSSLSSPKICQIECTTLL